MLWKALGYLCIFFYCCSTAATHTWLTQASAFLRHNFALADTPPGKRWGLTQSCWGSLTHRSEGGRLLIAGCRRHAPLWPCTCEQQGRTGVFFKQWPPVALWDTLGRIVSSVPLLLAWSECSRVLSWTCVLCSVHPCSGLQRGCSSTEVSLPRIHRHCQGWEFQLWLHLWHSSACRYFCTALISPCYPSWILNWCKSGAW